MSYHCITSLLSKHPAAEKVKRRTYELKSIVLTVGELELVVGDHARVPYAAGHAESRYNLATQYVLDLLTAGQDAASVQEVCTDTRRDRLATLSCLYGEDYYWYTCDPSTSDAESIAIQVLSAYDALATIVQVGYTGDVILNKTENKIEHVSYSDMLLRLSQNRVG